MVLEAVLAAGVAGLTLLVVDAFGVVPVGALDALSSGAGVDVGSSGIGAALGIAVGAALELGEAVASSALWAARMSTAALTMAISAPSAKIARTKNQTPLAFFLWANCAGAVGIAGGGAES